MIFAHLVLFSFLGGASGAEEAPPVVSLAVVIQDSELGAVMIAANEVVVFSDHSSVQHVAFGDDNSLLMVDPVTPIVRAGTSVVVVEIETMNVHSMGEDEVVL